MPGEPFVKRSPHAPAGYFAWEAAGLHWLSAADGAAVVRVEDFDTTSLTLTRLVEAPPTPETAREFGAALARTHDAGASAFGVGPSGYDGPGFFGPLHRPLSMSLMPHTSYGDFYAARLGEMLDHCGRLGRDIADGISSICSRLRAGEFDSTAVDPARVHGDLWSGNLMWTGDGAVLIDPAAHGGHRETDLAMLHLFGAPYLDQIAEGYQSQHRFAEGWRVRIPLHQLYPLLAHVAIFGGGYLAQTVAAIDALDEI